MGAKTNISLNYLLFDDDTTAEEKYRREVTINGCTCNIIYINPLDFYIADTNNFNKEAFISHIKTQTRGKEINLIATDWKTRGKEMKSAIYWSIRNRILNLIFYIKKVSLKIKFS